MKINERGLELEKHFESLHDGDLTTIGLQPKKDPKGIWTVGYGHAVVGKNGQHLIGASGKKAAYDLFPSLTLQDAESLLAKDNSFVEEKISQLVKVHLNSDQFSALVCFAYNVGVGAFSNSTMLKMLNMQDYDGASRQFRRWSKCDGVELRGLVRRRNNEKRLFLSLPFNFEDES